MFLYILLLNTCADFKGVSATVWGLQPDIRAVVPLDPTMDFMSIYVYLEEADRKDSCKEIIDFHYLRQESYIASVQPGR